MAFGCCHVVNPSGTGIWCTFMVEAVPHELIVRMNRNEYSLREYVLILSATILSTHGGIASQPGAPTEGMHPNLEHSRREYVPILSHRRQRMWTWHTWLPTPTAAVAPIWTDCVGRRPSWPCGRTSCRHSFTIAISLLPAAWCDDRGVHDCPCLSPDSMH